MPGLVGISMPNGREERREALGRMVECMLHEPFYQSKSLHLDECDLSLGWVFHPGTGQDAMPLWNERKTIGLVLLAEDAGQPADNSEPARLTAEQLLRAYPKAGAQVLEQLNGWFCGVLIDLESRQLLLFNDRFGVNRIFFHASSRAFYFASEAKALLRVRPELRRLDPVSVGEFLGCGCALQNRSLFAGVSVLPGGSAWRIAEGQVIRQGRFFQKESWEGQPPLSAPAFYEELKKTWARLLPHYFRGSRLGLSLTGGVDSRMILAWARESAKEIVCYTFCGNYRVSNDAALARKLAAACGHEHVTIHADEPFFANFGELARRSVFLSDGAMEVTGAFDLYVQKKARELSPLRLNGVYGGEILRRLVVFKPMGLGAGLWDAEMARHVEQAARTYAEERQGHPLTFTALKQAPWYMTAKFSVERSQLSLRTPYFDNDLVALAYRAPEAACASNDVSLRLIDEGNPALAKLATDRGLSRNEQPLLRRGNHLMQQFLFKAEYAYDYGMPQWLTRLDHCVAPLHLERLFLGRHGPTHFRVWYRDQLRDYLQEILLDPRTLGRGYLDRRALEKLVGDHLRGVGNYTLEISKLLSIELIMRLFVEAC